MLFLVISSMFLCGAGQAPDDSESTMDDYNEGISRDPDNARLYADRGVAWHEVEEYVKAIADYGEAIRLEPKLTVAYYNRGFSWYYKQKYNEAISDNSEAIQLKPDSAETYDNRGLMWHHKAVDFHIRLQNPGFAISCGSSASVAKNGGLKPRSQK